MNKERLLKLADFLEELPETKFNFLEVIYKYDEINNCGSVCCAVGWTPRLFPDEVSWDGFQKLINPHTNTQEPYTDVAERLFGINISDAEGLFSPDEQYNLRRDYIDDETYDPFKPHMFPDLGDQAKPKQVAQLIRNYVEVRDSQD